MCSGRALAAGGVEPCAPPGAARRRPVPVAGAACLVEGAGPQSRLGEVRPAEGSPAAVRRPARAAWPATHGSTGSRPQSESVARLFLLLSCGLTGRHVNRADRTIAMGPAATQPVALADRTGYARGATHGHTRCLDRNKTGPEAAGYSGPARPTSGPGHWHGGTGDEPAPGLRGAPLIGRWRPRALGPSCCFSCGLAGVPSPLVKAISCN